MRVVVADDAVLIREGLIRLLEEFTPGGPVAHKERRVGKDIASGYMIIMVVAVDHIAHRLISESFDLGLQPRRRLGSNRIGENHALRSDDKNGLMELMPEQIQALAQLRDLIVRPRLLSRRVDPLH